MSQDLKTKMSSHDFRTNNESGFENKNKCRSPLNATTVEQSKSDNLYQMMTINNFIKLIFQYSIMNYLAK